MTTCLYCRGEFNDPKFNWRRCCPKCNAKQISDTAPIRMEKFCELFCPVEYQTSNPDLIPNPSKHAVVVNWNYGPRGLFLIGESRAGKTRAMWMLMKRLFIDEAYSFEFFTGQSFALELGLSFKQDRYEDWFETVSNRKMMMFDDIDKTRFTERVQTELFSIIEYRMSRRLPVVISTNLAGDDLAGTMDVVGIPLVARLVEVCEPVNFGEMKS